MNMRYALLALLADGEAHGYQLLKEFHRRIGPFWHPNIGQVYQVLHDLEHRSLVARRDERSGTRLRRLFRLTARGQRALRVWLARRPAWPPPLRDELLIRLLAAESAGRDALLEQVGRQEAEYRRYLELVREDAARPSDEVTRRLAQEAATSLTEAYLQWLERCRTVLGESRLEGAA
jgi:DNA-binding PadR family transcriptional regulator